MRTSPTHVRRPSVRRAATALGVAGLLLSGAACGDGGDSSTPTTTAPAGSDDAPTTADAGPTTTAPDEGSPTTTEADAGTATETTAPGDDGGAEEPALTDAEAGQVISDLMASYRAAMAGAKAADADEEGLLVALSDVFLGGAVQDQVDGLLSFGGLEVVRPDPGVPETRAATVVGGDGECVTGTVRMLLDPMFTRSVGATQPHSFRLAPAPEGAPGPAWRLSYLSYASTGAYTEEAACAA